MNIYDTKSIYCKDCGKSMGGIEYDVKVILSEYERCVNPMSDADNIIVCCKYDQKSIKIYNHYVIIPVETLWDWKIAKINA